MEATTGIVRVANRRRVQIRSIADFMERLRKEMCDRDVQFSTNFDGSVDITYGRTIVGTLQKSQDDYWDTTDIRDAFWEYVERAITTGVSV